MLSPIFPREALFACPHSFLWNSPSFSVDLNFSTPCSRFGPPLSRLGTALSLFDSLPLYDLVIWTDGYVLFGRGESGVIANYDYCSLGGAEAILTFLAYRVLSRFSAKACTILPALRWSRQFQQVYHYSYLVLLHSDSCSVLFFPFPFSSISPEHLVRTVFALILYYQATMDPRIFIFFGKRQG